MVVPAEEGSEKRGGGIGHDRIRGGIRTSGFREHSETMFESPNHGPFGSVFETFEFGSEIRRIRMDHERLGKRKILALMGIFRSEVD